jgi:putative PEP-CTERM system TPR-repeat lipoprotein
MHARLAPALLASILVTGCFEPSPEAQLDKARQFLAKHETNAAIVAIKSALQAAPQSAAGRYLFGEALLAGGDAAAAEVELRKALELKQPEEQVVPSLARALLRQNKLNELIESLGKKEPQAAAARADLKTSVASAYALKGMAPESEAALDAALKAQPDYVPAQVMRLRLDMGKRDVLAAQTGLNQLLEKHPEDAGVWKLKGDFARAINPDPEAALSAYRKAIELDPTLLDAHSDAINLLFDMGNLDAVAAQLAKMKAVAGKHPQTLYFEARLDYRRGDYAAARTALQQALRRAPDYVSALELAGATELRLGESAQARAFLSKAIQSAPQRAMARRLLAQSLLTGGDADAALATLQPLLAANDAQSLPLAGEAYLAKGQFDQASKFYARAVKLNPDDVRSRTALATTAIQRGDVDKGLTELAAISAVDKSSQADLAIAIAHLASGKFAPALAAIDVIEKKQPKDPFAANLRGRALLMKGDKPAARASFEKALALRASYYPAAANLAAMDLADNHLEDAKRRFAALLAADPRNVQALLAQEQVLARMDAPDAERVKLIENAIKADAADPKPRIRLVDHYLQRKDAPKAMDAARNAAAALPDNFEIQEALGRTQFAAGELNQALTTFTRLTTAQPDSAQAYFALAEAQRAARNDDGARQSLKRALALAPDSLRARERLVELEVGAKHYTEALAVAKEVQRRQPKSRPGYLLEGDVELARRNVPAALKAYQTALAVEPSSTGASRVHSALLTADRRAEADQFADDWMKKHPKDGAFLAYLGDAALLRQDLEHAEKFYREAVQATPDHAIALNNLALTLYRQNKPGGLEFAQRADKVSPNTPAFMDTLAYLLAADGQQYPAAIELQKRAIALEPKNNLLRLTLARIYLRAGKDGLAEAELMELARLGNRFPGQQTVAELLKVARKAPAGAASASAR